MCSNVSYEIREERDIVFLVLGEYSLSRRFWPKIVQLCIVVIVSLYSVFAGIWAPCLARHSPTGPN